MQNKSTNDYAVNKDWCRFSCLTLKSCLKFETFVDYLVQLKNDFHVFEFNQQRRDRLFGVHILPPSGHTPHNAVSYGGTGSNPWWLHVCMCVWGDARVCVCVRDLI